MKSLSLFCDRERWQVHDVCALRDLCCLLKMLVLEEKILVHSFQNSILERSAEFSERNQVCDATKIEARGPMEVGTNSLVDRKVPK